MLRMETPCLQEGRSDGQTWLWARAVPLHLTLGTLRDPSRLVPSAVKWRCIGQCPLGYAAVTNDPQLSWLTAAGTSSCLTRTACPRWAGWVLCPAGPPPGPGQRGALSPMWASLGGGQVVLDLRSSFYHCRSPLIGPGRSHGHAQLLVGREQRKKTHYVTLTIYSQEQFC